MGGRSPVTRCPRRGAIFGLALAALLLNSALLAESTRIPTFDERRRAYQARAATRREALRQKRAAAALRNALNQQRQQVDGAAVPSPAPADRPTAPPLAAAALPAAGAAGAGAAAGGAALAAAFQEVGVQQLQDQRQQQPQQQPPAPPAPGGAQLKLLVEPDAAQQQQQQQQQQAALQQVTLQQLQPQEQLQQPQQQQANALQQGGGELTVGSLPVAKPNKERAFMPFVSHGAPKQQQQQQQAWVKPKPFSNFQYQLGEAFNPSQHLLPNVTVYVVDLFDTTPAAVAAIKAAGGYPVCYFSAGYEEWRPDKAAFPKAALANPMDGWPGERWTDLRNPVIAGIMKKRFELCKQKGFLGAEVDNVDILQLPTGLTNLTSADQLAFIRKMADLAHEQGIAYALKNTLLQVKNMTDKADFAINESCAQFKECKYYEPFNQAGIAVFNVEYQKPSFDRICPIGSKVGMRTILKDSDLKAQPRTACPGLP